MLPSQISDLFQTYRKLCFTLIAVLVTFGTSSKDSDALFISDGLQVTGLDHVSITPPTPAISGIIYVEQNVVFYAAESTITAKVVYFWTTSTLQKGERLLSTIGSKKIKAKKQPTLVNKLLAPFGNLPFQGAVFSNTYNCIAAATTSILQISKPTFYFQTYTYPTAGDFIYANVDSKSKSPAYYYCTPHHKIAVLSSYYSLPPPLAITQHLAKDNKEKLKKILLLKNILT
jgi:hypothetical protein